jgi:hypothetical protein
VIVVQGPISACLRLLNLSASRAFFLSSTATATYFRADEARAASAVFFGHAVHDHGTKALAIDDITRLKMHREADYFAKLRVLSPLTCLTCQQPGA